MKKIILLCMLFAIVLWAHSQERIRFGYDSYGNRMERKYVISVEKKRSVKSTDDPQESGIGEPKREVRIYPNPTKGNLQIETSGCQGGMGLRLYSSSGQLIRQTDTSDPSASLDFSEYPEGTYVLWLLLGKERQEYKIIKE